MLGDNLYGGEGPDDFARKFERPYKALLDGGVKFHAVLGNHDDPKQAFYKPFNMNGERYYSFKAPQGSVRFFALNSNYMDKAQLAWLEKELSASDSGWKIAFFHHPLYSSGDKHGADEVLREQLEPLFLKYGVDLVLTGHEHFYERIKPQKGIHYFVAGSSAKLRKGQLKRLGETLDRAEQRAGAVPRPQTPQTPQGAPQGPRPPSSTGRPPPAGARSQSDPGPTTRMLAAYQRYYEGMSPDEAEVDLRAEMAQDPSLTARGIPSPRTLAKQQAYSRLYPNRPLTMRIPDVPPPGAAPQPVTPRPGATRTGPRAPDAAGSATAHAPEPGGAAVGAVLR